MTNDCAVQIVEHYGENNFKVKKEVLKEIYGNERVSNLPLVVLCIAGAARKGKSFMLNFFLDYLIHKEKSPKKSWTLNETTRLNGFEFQDGEDRTTLGIWAWNHVFIVENGNGKKVAVSLIDSQGTFDKSTSYEDCSAIFAMTSMFSSVMCFNVFNDLQEDKLNDFTAFIEHGKKIVQNLGGSGKLFQSLVFIIRDFCYFKKYSNEENGGQKYVENQLGDVSNQNLQKVRDNLKESYERMFGFVFPYPGEKVAQERTSNISEINQIFVKNAKTMVETLLSQNNLQIKKLGTSQVLCRDMAEYIPLCVKCFNDHPKFAPQAVQTVNRQFMISLEVKRAIKAYESLMDKVFVICKNGYDTQTLMQNHNIRFTMIKQEISERIKDKNISSDVVEKITEEINYSIFPKYQEKNAFLIENEKKRLYEKRQYEEQLARRNAEAAAKLEAQRREHQMQQEKERQERLKCEAEFREKIEKERKENERIERKEEKRRAEEKTAKIQRENEANIAMIAKLKLDNEQHEREQHEREQRERERSRASTPSVICLQQPPSNGFGYGLDLFGGNMGGICGNPGGIMYGNGGGNPGGNMGGNMLGNGWGNPYRNMGGNGRGNSGGNMGGSGRSSSSGNTAPVTQTLGKDGRIYYHQKGHRGFVSKPDYL